LERWVSELANESPLQVAKRGGNPSSGPFALDSDRPAFQLTNEVALLR